jgi:hypothetical protein
MYRCVAHATAAVCFVSLLRVCMLYRVPQITASKLGVSKITKLFFVHFTIIYAFHEGQMVKIMTRGGGVTSIIAPLISRLHSFL